MEFSSYSPCGSFLDYNSKLHSNSISNTKYRKKYMKMKQTIKNLVFENAALCDQVSLIQEQVMIVKEERRYLLKKLYHFQAVSDMENQLTSAKMRGTGTSPPVATAATQESTPPVKKVANKKTKTSSDTPEGARTTSAKSKKSGRTKKLVQPIPLDITGRPVFPIVLGGLTVHSIGEVVTDRPRFHTEDLIFPVGFCSSRIYGSLKDPEQKCVYTCKVLDGGSAPRFEIASDNDMDMPITDSSANQCHSMLLQLINESLGLEVVKTEGKGPEFFGFSNPTIQNLIQSSTGIRKCPGYKTMKFEVCKTGENLDLFENDASLNFDALQRNIAFSKQHLTSISIKEEPQDSINNSLRDLLKTP